MGPELEVGESATEFLDGQVSGERSGERKVDESSIRPGTVSPTGSVRGSQVQTAVSDCDARCF